MHPHLTCAVADLARAKSELVLTVNAIQEDCVHEFVAETPFVGGDYASLNARRICYRCRLEEEGSIWSEGNTWSEVHYNAAKLGNEPDRIIITISDRDKFYALRV